MPAPLLKDPAEPLTVAFAFAQAATLVESVTVNALGLVPGAAPVVASSAIVSGRIDLVLTGGSDGERYDIAVLATHAGGPSSERVVTIAAIDASWTMSDGAEGWLSIIEFAERFGLDEIVAATQSDGAGVIDRRFLIGALRDAQAECAANLAGRYTLPLSAVPDILKTAVADLAAVRLYRRGAPDYIESAAKAQRDNLKRIAAGGLPLPGVAGVAIAQENASEAPVTGWSGGRVYPDNLAGY